MKQIYSLLFLFGFLFLSRESQSQDFERFNFEVIQNGKTLKNPLTGGINSPQLSAVDLNEDGILDLHVFNRVGNVHLTFINEGTTNEASYVFAPDYIPNFPVCVNWAMLRDYNQDGAYDLFAHGGIEGIDGIRVFKGKFTDGKLNFERVNFNTSFNFNVLPFTQANGNQTQVFVFSIDYPDINDIDGDGDLDVLSFPSSGGNVYWYKNRSQEMGYGADSLIFRLQDNCWGRFFEADLSEEIILSDDINVCAPGLDGPAQDRHQGSTLLTFDEDGDGDREVVIGDVSNRKLFRLHNGGDADVAWMTEQDSEYPTYDTPVDVPYFVSSFYLDLDNDGLKDFAAAPNERGSTPDYETIWFYKNINTNENPIFELKQTDLLTDEMIDVGTGAYPTFADVNADGLLDLVIGTTTIFQEDGNLEPFLRLYENVGTKTQPIFELKDDNWLNYNALSEGSVLDLSYTFAPTFGDLDDDGDLDLLVGERRGRLIFSENIAGKNNPMEFAPPVMKWQDIEIGQNSVPQIVDLNRDGKQDLAVGERRGKMTFFPNQGTPSEPQFHSNHLEAPNNNQLGGIKKVNAVQVGNLTPIILDYADDFKLIFGWENGRLHLYENIENNLDGDFLLVDDYWGKIWEGSQTAPALADLNDDGFLELAVGNRRGGLSVFKTGLEAEPSLSSGEKLIIPTLELFPNPASNSLTLIAKNITVNQTKCLIFNSTGQLISETKLNQTENNLDVSGLAGGIYFCKIQSKNGNVVKRFVKH